MNDKLLLCRLREYRTRDGRRYLRGFLAETKVLVFKDERGEVPPGCEAVWNVFLEPSAPREPNRTEAPRHSASNSARSRFHPPADDVGGARVSTRTKRKAPASTAEDFDDRLDDVEALR